jgi:thiol-disulfide isomerase/thioredoxin
MSHHGSRGFRLRVGPAVPAGSDCHPAGTAGPTGGVRRALLLAGATLLLAVRAEAALELRPATAAQVQQAVRDAGARVVVVNVWATWCIPCREEFPALLRLEREYRSRGVKLLLVSADFDNATDDVKQFLAEQGVDFRTYLKAEKDQAFIDGVDPAWSGALPATFLYDSSGKLRKSILTPVTFETLKVDVDDLLEGPQ